MDHIQDMQNIFFYYVLGEHEGNRLLRRESKNPEIRTALIREFNNITMLLTTDPKERRYINTLIQISERPKAVETLSKGIERYGYYLLRHIPTGFYRMIEEHEKQSRADA